MNTKLELVIVTGYGAYRVYVITGDATKARDKAEELSKRFTKVSLLEVTEAIEKDYPTLSDRWAYDEIEEIKV